MRERKCTLRGQAGGSGRAAHVGLGCRGGKSIFGGGERALGGGDAGTLCSGGMNALGGGMSDFGGGCSAVGGLSRPGGGPNGDSFGSLFVSTLSMQYAWQTDVGHVVDDEAGAEEAVAEVDDSDVSELVLEPDSESAARVARVGGA